MNKDPKHIGSMFSALAKRYDLANRILSFNQDKRWRNVLINLANPHPHDRILDLCTGTGDLALEFSKRKNVSVVGVDISEKMLEVANQKMRVNNLSEHVQFLEGDVLQLPFPDAQFECVTIAFGLRNLPDYQRGLKEMYRVLTPGGKLLVLEFSQPKGIWGQIYMFYLRHFLPIIGGWITGHPAAYRYLDESIRRFPAREDLSVMLETAGFIDVGNRPLSGGIALIHHGLKRASNSRKRG